MRKRSPPRKKWAGSSLGIRQVVSGQDSGQDRTRKKWAGSSLGMRQVVSGQDKVRPAKNGLAQAWG